MVRTYFAASAAILLCGLAAFYFLFREDDAAYMLRVGRLDSRWQTLAAIAIEEIVGSSKLGQDYAFNETRGERPIVFIVFDSRLSKTRASKRGSCGYYPSSKSVFCDVSFIDSFLSQRDFDKRAVSFEGDRPIDQPSDLEPVPDEQYDDARLFMLQWVLGHEFGHFLSGHQASSFAPTTLDSKVEAKSLSQAAEIEADGFLATHFDPTNKAGNRFYQTLIYLLNVEVHRKACPGMSPLQYCNKIQFGAGIFSPSVAVYFKTGGSHPEYVIRLIRLLKEAHERYDLGPIGHLTDSVVNTMQEEARNGQTCILGVFCW